MKKLFRFLNKFSLTVFAIVLSMIIIAATLLDVNDPIWYIIILSFLLIMFSIIGDIFGNAYTKVSKYKILWERLKTKISPGGSQYTGFHWQEMKRMEENENYRTLERL